MTIEERAEKAAALKAEGKCNCAQAVVSVFADRIPVDHDTLMKLTSGFAAGMGCMESTCGALTGAVMAAGILTDGHRTPAYAAQILREFEQRSGALICRDLKGINTGKPVCPCPDCVRNAVLAAGAALNIRD
ncbi:MAG: C-GCAxxG-C-C family protein [Lactimicrobium massiliense]|nr:C-GCAxxG-C-C family protein [Lactimicrobium massiliense]MDD6230007.1 C-GCAxxG-C-C family protein [Lactimicrobium massiliense]